ncbi:hypothetical protein [Pontibacter rugosus]|uniref:PH domain-containing protein n=1 Tax=Pontibacter rugosus TaxID=1745966 RepID=A0ABW3SNT4_9BACT
MYINLYPNKSLKSTKKSLLLTGAFLTVGGGYALLREFLWLPVFREEWAFASALLILIGGFMLAFGADVFRFNDAFFSMNRERIAYRLTLWGSIQEIYWKDLNALEISWSLISFELTSGKRLHLRLEAIQQPEVARHVSRSLHLAALNHNLPVNGLKTFQAPALQV